MNRAQRLILVIGLLLIVVSGLYVPYQQDDPSGNLIVEADYAFRRDIFGSTKVHQHIDYRRMLVSWVMIAAATGAGLVLTSRGLFPRRSKGMAGRSS